MSRTIFAVAALMLALSAAARAEEQRFVFEKAEMGVPFRLTFYAVDEAKAKAAAEAAFAHLEVLNSILSDYDPESELSRLGHSSGAGKATPVSNVLWTVLTRSQELAERTDGAFDVTVGPLVNLWRRSRRKRELPSHELLQRMRARVGYRFMRLNPDARTVELMKPDMRLDVGGIAKGYAADEALRVLAEHGVTRALIAASGDIVAGDPPPGEQGWRVGIPATSGESAAAPEVILLAHRAVSTSGDTYQYVEIGGIRYSHVVDPRTGIGLTDRSLVTVVARDGLTADGLDTAIDVHGWPKSAELLAAYPEAVARGMRFEGGTRKEWVSRGWENLPRPK